MSMLKRIRRGAGLKRWGVIASTFSVSLLLATGVALAQGGGQGPGGNPGGGPGGGPPDKPGEEEVAGNNLSFPVIWSDGEALPLRGVYGAPMFDGVPYQGTYYLQQDPDNAWQAGSFDPVAELAGAVDVTQIDWGDGLEAPRAPLTENSIIRVETVLYQDLPAGDEFWPSALTEFNMTYLFGDGPDEMWGTDTTTTDSTRATVYSDFARLTIQKLTNDPDVAADPSLTWDATDKQWEDADGAIAGLVFFNDSVTEGVDGPGDYGAEVNVPGKVIYGYNWNVRKAGNGPGVYRLTFSLDQAEGLNTVFETTELKPFEEVEEPMEPLEAAPGGGGVPVLLLGDDLTYIDIPILPRLKGKGGRPDHALGAVGGIPEPSTIVLAGILLLGGAAALHRRRK